MQLIRYRGEDGVIVNVWSANTRELLEAQCLPDEPAYGYLYQETEMESVLELVERHRIQKGQLVTKREEQ